MSSGITPTPPPSSQASKSVGQVVQIVSLPDALQNNARGVRLDGEVIGQNKDGSTRIQTAQGNIDIVVRGKQPQVGVKVEVDVPAGNPPRNATIRPAPPAPPTTQGNITPPSSASPPRADAALPQTQQTQQSSGQNQSSNAAPSTEKPLPPNYQAPIRNTSNAGTPPPPLTTQQIVRLTSLPPAQAQTITNQSLQNATQTAQNPVLSQIVRLSFQSDLIAKSAPDALQNILSESIKPAPSTNSLPTSVTTAAATLPKSASSFSTFQTSPLYVEKIILGALFEATETSPSANQVQTALISKNPLQTLLPLAASITQGTDSVHTTHQFIFGTPSAPKLSSLDIKILDIKPFSSLTPPPANTQNALLKTDSSLAFFKSNMSGNGIALPQETPTTLTGIVTGFTAQKLPILTIKFSSGALSQSFTLQYPASNVEVGTKIIFTPQVNNTGINTASLNAATSLQQALSVWPAFDEIFQTLAQLSPQGAQIMARMLPSPASASNMGSAAMLFIAAVRSGDVGGWLGDRKIDLLTKAGKDTIIKRFMADAGNALTSNADGPSSEWRSYPLPMLWQNEVSKTMLHFKHDGEEKDKDNPHGGTRFVMDLTLTRMGDVQLDGFLKDKRLDLVIRTQIPISLPMQDAMKIAYADALDGTNIYGELGFQGDIKSWMNVIKREDKFTLSS